MCKELKMEDDQTTTIRRQPNNDDDHQKSADDDHSPLSSPPDIVEDAYYPNYFTNAIKINSHDHNPNQLNYPFFGDIFLANAYYIPDGSSDDDSQIYFDNTKIQKEYLRMKSIIASKLIETGDTKKHYDFNFQFSILGGHNVGKSSLLSRFSQAQDRLNGHTIENIGNSIYKQTDTMDFRFLKGLFLNNVHFICLNHGSSDPTLSLKKWEKLRILRIQSLVVDTCVEDVVSQEATQCPYIHGVQGIFVMYDVTNRNSYEYAKQLLQQIKEANPTAVVILLANKIDLDGILQQANDQTLRLYEQSNVEIETSTSSLREVTSSEGAALATEFNIRALLEISCKNDYQVDDTLATMIGLVLEKLLPTLSEESLQLLRNRYYRQFGGINGCAVT